ncbi:hypothetical protein [Shouchella clausii]|jgi:hypothetical protein|uniref:Uncharacterized protein n=1 Tax=Shouchella clausii TaxID=79880 RepID=A0A268RZ34_SHOCL|nr:hypothetical protein [Shouchella clausii]PAD43122.1 hypothetical protein CHH54_08905 [Bacillus sp. 7520-S]AST97201.1 hypothetical protein BC8716_15025 [Shouchella clausii]MBU8594743.1 hypothetical protein [Shouchella clausii]MCM3547301.1 hypothetical protein [Shouchella clausii]MCR1287961.1 hypothetical protein [Shouchella clausii]
MKRKILLRIALVLIAFYLYILGLLHLFPIWVAVPLLFIALFCLFRPLKKKPRFKGYRPH